MLTFSIIIPVYNRPDEVEELLHSLAKQTYRKFEVIIVEDGSSVRCEDAIKKYQHQLIIRYFYKKNEKPSIARNFGISKANGNYFLFFDSDCIIPENYMQTVCDELTRDFVDAYGGPDSAHSSFSSTQKAINYAMTSLITTGGIRGKEKISKFYPRGFNMGFSRKVYETTGGFPITNMHPGEDMMLSIEIVRIGFKTKLIQEAFVFHKRRTTLKQFFKQVFKFGKMRVVISKVYPETFKIFYALPSFFIFVLLALLVSMSSIPQSGYLIILFALLIFFDSYRINKDVVVAAKSVLTSFIQLTGYGLGFLTGFIKVYFLGIDEYGVLKKGFRAG